MEGGNPAVIVSAAYLHDIGIPIAEEMHRSAASNYQEREGPAVARSILIRLGAPDNLIDSVCEIVGRHHPPRSDETVELKVVYDSHWIANMEDKLKTDPMISKAIIQSIETSLLTEGGRKTAKDVLL
jgi:hypothetical protein